MTRKRDEKIQSLEDFLEEDLPFLIKSHYDDTIIIIKKELQLHNLSFDVVVSQYPNFLEKIKYHLFFFFAHQMSEITPEPNNDLYAHYCAIAKAYRNQYIYSFVENQIKDRTIQDIIKYQKQLDIIYKK
ncbi:hypothetical protein H1P_4040006 [Hyella patelloides LEGE 07179]|uniref:Uncharacterized protein n=1 Tax=Hyella patelloides LEGE 07179 TaxID=945734 RepID=A0A563VXJ6_9CYAN|nr:hypothetical protein [Hyella patelloides]VEP16107.1 hypothetical protein H1P_4040006 [Hyella patelloides LEGE 07179]